jgi:ParB-like chromosome segregation protein Spo0J
MQSHPAADLFPMMDKAELQDLADDIKKNGLISPVITLGELILDGRNRWQACELAGVEPVTREYTGKLSPVDYVLSQNLHRRHLTVNQRATIAAMMANMTHGGDRKSEDIKASKEALISQAEAAEKMQVSRASVQRAEYVIKNAPELAEQVKAGEVTLPQALKTIRRTNPLPRKERGSYDEWKQFKGLAKQIHDLIKQLKPLTADKMHQHERNQTVKALIEELKGI